MSSRIEDYALIGDCHTAALVARDGSIDWLCLPQFDSGACFAALLGTPDNGRWQIAPASGVRQVNRRYREDTIILETEFETDSGLVAIIDFMPPRANAAEVMRIVECRRGEVPMHMELTIRFDYGRIVPWVRRTDDGIRAIAGPDTVYCRTDVELHGENMHTIADFTIGQGQRIPFTLTWSPTHKPPPPVRDPLQLLNDTQAWWQAWSGKCTYTGQWRQAVMRSLITLKALTFAPTGGIAAAVTTSLPEHIGGIRNWDYRFCWVRDATFTLYALVVGGYKEEACAFRKWLLYAVAGVPSELQIMYGLAGQRRLHELSLDWLPGYENSHPVHTGNDAYRQHQLDVYGEVMDACYLARRIGLPPDENAWRVQRSLMDFLEGDWVKPDSSIWEIRGPERQYTHSKVMAWVAADRCIRSAEQFNLEGDLARWRRLRQQIHDEICREGFDPQLNSFVQFYGAKHTDASLLTIPQVGFLPATDPRVQGTVRFIQKTLTKDGLLLRYPPVPEVDHLPPGEGAFLMCTFWLVDALALMGQHDEARELYERLLSLRNDVGLLSEEYAPQAQRMLGNFPQAFSHVGLVNAARNLSDTGGPAEHRQGAGDGLNS